MGDGNAGRSRCRTSASPRIAWFFCPEMRTRKPSVEQAFGRIKQQIKPQDNFLLILIGHGSFDTDYKLNIMGEDLTGKDYGALIDSLGAGAYDHHQQHALQRWNVRNHGGKESRRSCGKPKRRKGRHGLLRTFPHGPEGHCRRRRQG